MLRVINGIYDAIIRRPTSKIRVFEYRFPDIPSTYTPYEKRFEIPRQTFSDNNVVTSKYTFFTFIPRSLFEQFRRVANVYFLGISVLMIVGTYTDWFDSPISPWSTLFTLAVVIFISMFKEGAEDIKRHKADAVTNNQPTHRLNRCLEPSIPIFEKTEWWRLAVGNVVKVCNNEEVPADMILLTSSEMYRVAHVETSNIDGETNLKPKVSVKVEGDEWEKIEQWQRASIKVRCDLPNSSIHFFNGNMDVNGQQVGLDTSNLLLRGCRLKNTNWILGLVVYTGKQSKVVMNSRSVPSKLSFLEKTMNTLIYVIFFGQVFLSFISLITYVVWKTINLDYLTYLCYNYEDSVTSLLADNCESTTEYTDIAYFVTFFILYNNFIPISLYVTVELVNYCQAFFIDSDIDMYHEDSDQPALARTSNMNSDLGMVEYIFSDKTGTLTDNIMKFRLCSVGGNVYASMDRKPEETVSPFEQQAKHIADLAISDPQKADEFAFILAVCHSVVIDTVSGEFRTESPDEEALVKAATLMGWSFVDRRPNEIIVNRRGEELSYKLLVSIPFTSARKRMSVIVEMPDGKKVLLSKGADNVIFDRSIDFAPFSADVNYYDHVAGSDISPRQMIELHLKNFASEGLRTLLVAKRDISSSEYSEFDNLWSEADRSLTGREQLYDAAAALVEKDLTVVAATAIEDKLQHGVPETIADLMSAGIKLWVLTGDKMETAINIGYSAKLLVPEMILLKMQYKGEYRNVRRKLHALFYHMKRLTENVEMKPKSLTPWQRLSRACWNFGKSCAKCDFDEICGHCCVCCGEDWSAEDQEDIDIGDEERRAAFNSFTKGSTEDTPLLKKATTHPEINIDELSSDHLSLIVDGETLTGVFGDPVNERMFLSIAKVCKSVIACRVSPEQKRMMVKLVKLGVSPRPVTLSIGDGANDVAMIQEAQIGVGISGREGRQAVNSSDFAFGQFRFLKKALLVHGRWDYRRTSKVVLYSFYKNIVLSIVVFFFTFYSGYSGQLLFDDYIYSLYNIVLFLPVIAFGVFDRDVAASSLMKNFVHYEKSRLRQDLNPQGIYLEMFHALVDALIIYYVPHFIYNMLKDIWMSEGKQAGLWVYGTTVYNCLMFCMFLRIVLVTCTWTWFAHAAFFISLSLYIVFLIVYQYFYEISYNYYGVTAEMMYHPLFWSIAAATCVCFWLVKGTIQKIIDLWFTSNNDAITSLEAEEVDNEDDFNPKNGHSDKISRAPPATDTHRYPVSWVAVKQWFTRMPKQETENLGVQNIENGPISLEELSPEQEVAI